MGQEKINSDYVVPLFFHDETRRIVYKKHMTKHRYIMNFFFANGKFFFYLLGSAWLSFENSGKFEGERTRSGYYGRCYYYNAI